MEGERLLLICKVVGSVWATRKEDHLNGLKFLVVQPHFENSEINKNQGFVAVDRLGAGIGDQVIVSRGASASYIYESPKLPIDSLVIGIIDSIDYAEGDQND